MKRQRPTEEDNEEPATKINHLDQSSELGPFNSCLAAVWKNFWLAELLPHLTPIHLYKISCLSKPLHSFVWNHLIPVSPDGMHFGPDITLEAFEKYLDRVPGLQKLVLNKIQFRKGDLTPILCLLPKITKLSSLTLPPGGTGATSQRMFPFVSHLTNLTHLNGIGADELPHFKQLKDTEIWNGKKMMIQANQLTNLERLLMNLKDLPVRASISNLTKLTFLSLYYKDTKTTPKPLNGLGDLTNLTHLLISGSIGHGEISKLTNLQELGWRAHVLTNESFHNTVKFLTNLRKLTINDASNTLTDAACEFVTCLTNLTSLGVESALISSKTIASLACLPSLTSLYVGNQSDQSRLEAIASLKNLQEISVLVHSDFLSTLQNMHNLTSLYLGFPLAFPGSLNHFQYFLG
jgi:hypothetical protein